MIITWPTLLQETKITKSTFFIKKETVGIYVQN